MRTETQYNETWNHLGELVSVEVFEVTFNENDNEISRIKIEE